MLANDSVLPKIIEALLLAAGKPMPIARLQVLLSAYQPDVEDIQQALVQLQQACADRAVELVELASGYQYQTRAEWSAVIAGLFSEKPSKLSRALLETLALIVYRQPITRSEIEQIRGVSVSSAILKTLDERGWIRIVGQREVPGRPSLYATTNKLLDDLGCKCLEDLPSLPALQASEAEPILV